MQRGDAVDIAILFSSLLDQRHIRNYVVMLPRGSYVLTCDISPSALYQAGGRWQGPTSTSVLSRIVAADDSPGMPHTEWIDAYALNIGDAPCPCLLLNPSGPINQQPGDPLPFFPDAVHSTMDLEGQRHALISSTLSDTAHH
jgi:hypothetical protein